MNEAPKNELSNCSYYVISDNADKNKIWKLAEMDADHVTAWSKGGATERSNCEMLCKSHNRAKGNGWKIQFFKMGGFAKKSYWQFPISLM